MTLILPAIAPLTAEPIARLHAPEGRFGTFRDCLRWEFGFSCPLCLLHERDLITTGADGWAVVTIEHRYTPSDHPERADEYVNCIYACRRCNTTRRSQSEMGVLNPMGAAWADHFEWVADDLMPRDAEAVHTAEVFGLNDEQRRKMRERRRETITLLRAHRTRVLEALSDSAFSDVGKALLNDTLAILETQLREWSAIPSDAPTACRCTQPCALPAHANAGLWELD